MVALTAFAVLSSLSAIKLVMVVAKFGSLPKAAASSFKVSSVSGADATKAATAACTKAVLAISCELFPTAAVGTLGVPVKVGDATSAFKGKSTFSSLVSAVAAVSALCLAETALLAALVSDSAATLALSPLAFAEAADAEALFLAAIADSEAALA